MEINNIYETKINGIGRLVYEGTCDGVPTKWVTKSSWNYKIHVQLVHSGVMYSDDNGEEILVFDEDDEEYKSIRK